MLGGSAAGERTARDTQHASARPSWASRPNLARPLALTELIGAAGAENRRRHSARTAHTLFTRFYSAPDRVSAARPRALAAERGPVYVCV